MLLTAWIGTGAGSRIRSGTRIAALLACLVGFCLIAWFSTTATGQAADRWLLLSLQSVGEETLPRGPAWIREAGRDLTALGSISVLILVIVAGTGWLLMLGRWRLAAFGGVTIILGILASFGLKLLFEQPRPDLVSNVTPTFTSSFPSSHAMASLVTYLGLALLLASDKRRRAMARYLIVVGLGVSIVSGVSRVYLGVHWPSDVVAGWLAGLTWLLLIGLIAGWPAARQRA